MRSSKIYFVLRQIYRIIVLNFVNILTTLIPKDKKLIIFGGWNGEKFIDNSKYLFIYFLSKNDGFKKIWITKNRNLCINLNSEGYKTLYAYSIKGIIIQAQASVVVFNQSVEADFISCLIKLNNLRIQLWHGTPIKKIGYSDRYNIYTKRLMSISNILIPFYNDRLDMCIAIGDFDKQIYKNAFNVEEKNIVITGYPRNDILFCENKIRNSTNLRILYLPTLRIDFSELLKYILNDVIIDEIDQLLIENECELYIKLHPAQIKQNYFTNYINGKKKIKFIFQDNQMDIYEDLLSYDILITDISGVYFDLLLTQIKIYTYFPDIEMYLSNERDIYYNVEEISVSKIYNKFNNLIKDCINNIYDFDRHNQLKQKFHKFTDGKSCQRVYEEILNKISSE